MGFDQNLKAGRYESRLRPDNPDEAKEKFSLGRYIADSGLDRLVRSARITWKVENL